MSSNQPYQPKHLTCRTVEEFDPASFLYADNENVDPSVDRNGAFWVQVAPPVTPTNIIRAHFYSNSFEMGAPNRLITLNGFNDSASLLYVQFFTTAPGVNDPPDINVLRVPAGGSFSWTPAYPLAGGIWAVRCSSSANAFVSVAGPIWLFAELMV